MSAHDFAERFVVAIASRALEAVPREGAAVG